MQRKKRMSALPPISTAKANMKFPTENFAVGRGDTLVCGRSGFFGQETGGKALQLLTLPVPRERHGYQSPFDTWVFLANRHSNVYFLFNIACSYFT